MPEKKEEAKPWYLSKGVMGSAGAVIAMILGIWYTDIKADDITAILIAGGGVISGIIGLIGRLTAKSDIK